MQDRMITSEDEATIREMITNVHHLDGDIAEVGVSVGDSAEIICGLKRKKRLHLFDTFEGHPDTIGVYDVGQTVGRHKADISDVKKRLKQYSNVWFYKGIFPQTTTTVRNKKFCLVNLDTDLYRGTYDGLEFFVPRMVLGGIIIIHDIPGIPGVYKALIDYFEEHKEYSPANVTMFKNQAVIKL